MNSKRKAWWEANRTRIAARKRAAYRRRCAEDIAAIRRERRKYAKAPSTPNARKRASLRSNLSALVRGKNRPQVLALLGCSRAEFLAHIERQFEPGWTWSGYGKVFELDHIRPCREFDLTDPVQQRACFHFTNIRPLEKGRNRGWRGALLAA